MSKSKIVVDLNVIPKQWTVEQFYNVIENTGLVIVDTEHYPKDKKSGIAILDEDSNLKVVNFDDFQEKP